MRCVHCWQQRSNGHRGIGAASAVSTSPSLSEGDIVDLPVMTKTDLMDNFDAIVTDPRLSRQLCEDHLDQNPGDHLLGEFQVVASGGSSGLRGVFVYGWEAWATCYASNIRFQTREWSLDPSLAQVPRVIAVVAASSPTHISAALSKTFATGDHARHLFPVNLRLEEIVDGLNELQPTVLMAYSSFLPRLAMEAQGGRLHITPRRIVAISEPLLPETRQIVHQTWGAPIANGYAMSEGVFSGFCGHGIHLPDDLIIFEPVDVDGRPVGAGELVPPSARHQPLQPGPALDPLRGDRPTSRIRSQGAGSRSSAPRRRAFGDVEDPAERFADDLTRRGVVGGGAGLDRGAQALGRGERGPLRRGRSPSAGGRLAVAALRRRIRPRPRRPCARCPRR